VKPETEQGFNEHFMAGAGTRITRDIASPALWPVKSLEERFRSQPEVFRDPCKLKWSFRIKPDLLIEIPELPPICVEAKLESAESRYPTGDETKVFDRVFENCEPERRNRRVGQFELQQFMFKDLLGRPCQPVIVQRIHGSGPEGTPVLTWGEVLSSFEASGALEAATPSSASSSTKTPR